MKNASNWRKNLGKLAVIMAVFLLLSPISGFAATPEVAPLETENILVAMSEFTTAPMVSAGNSFTVALKSDGTVWSWGYNYFGQLGDGTTTTAKRTPVRVTGLTDVISVSAGHTHTAVLKADGTVWTWGYNWYGQLGDGTIINKHAPVQVTGLTGVIAVSAGDEHTVALKADGTVWAWGHNWTGQLGTSTTTMYQSSTPVQIVGLTGITAISAGHSHTVALKSDGTAWAWGNNSHGQLGDGSTTWGGVPQPVQVAGLADIIAVSVGSRYTVALKADGTAWAWGYNYYGQLGDGTTADRHTPVQITGLTGVTDISAGAVHTVASTLGGTAWAWGSNNRGQLGDGTETDRHTPVQVTGLTGVTAVSAANSSGATVHTIALKSDGAVWAWGDNWYGQLGLGDYTSTNSFTPVQVLGEGGVGFLNLGATALADLTVVFELNGGTRIGGGEVVQAVPSNGAAIAPEIFRSGWIFDGWDTYFGVVTENIVVTAQWLRLGAITNNGESVSSADVVWVARHVAGHAGFELSEQDKRLVDINGDGVVDAADITALMRWLVGWELGEV